MSFLLSIIKELIAGLLEGFPNFLREMLATKEEARISDGFLEETDDSLFSNSELDGLSRK